MNGLSPVAAGLVLTPGAVAMAILSPMAGRLSDRIGVRIPILVGLTVMLLSIFFVSAFGAGESPLLVSVGMLGAGVGFALANSKEKTPPRGRRLEMERGDDLRPPRRRRNESAAVF